MSSVARLNMRQREKMVMKYYDDGGPGRGHCTWGIGTLAHRGPCKQDELEREVTEEQIEYVFATKVKEAERAVDRNVKVELSQAQFDALVSFTYNRGVGGTAPVYALLNGGDFQGAANRISNEKYSRQKRNGKMVRVLLRGLIPRRAEESEPFRAQNTENQ
jgi:lysozyme